MRISQVSPEQSLDELDEGVFGRGAEEGRDLAEAERDGEAEAGDKEREDGAVGEVRPRGPRGALEDRAQLLHERAVVHVGLGRLEAAVRERERDRARGLAQPRRARPQHVRRELPQCAQRHVRHRAARPLALQQHQKRRQILQWWHVR